MHKKPSPSQAETLIRYATETLNKMYQAEPSLAKNPTATKDRLGRVFLAMETPGVADFKKFLPSNFDPSLFEGENAIWLQMLDYDRSLIFNQAMKRAASPVTSAPSSTITNEQRKILVGYGVEMLQRLDKAPPYSALEGEQREIAQVRALHVLFSQLHNPKSHNIRFFPKKYDISLFTVEGGNHYDALWPSMKDVQHTTVIKQAIALYKKTHSKITSKVEPSSAYAWFKLKNRLKINRRNKEYEFKRGDNIGWRFSSNGKFFRLVSLASGPTIVFSIKITDESLKWLVGHDPKARKRTVN
jgi:hypothetical protein